jgi:hypothetical protein
MTTETVTPTQTHAGRSLLTAWARDLGTGTPASIREIAALPAAKALMPTGDLRELGTWLWRNASAVPGFRARRIRRGVSQRKPRGEAGYFWRPAIWTLEVVQQGVSR